MKRYTILPLLSLLAATPAMGVITVVASLGDLQTGARTTQTVSFDAAAGTKLVVAVSAEARGNNSNPASAVDSITFGGVALTSSVSAADPTTQQLGAIYFLDAPATGPQNLTLTWDGDVNGGAIAIYSLTGALAGSAEAVATNDAGLTVGLTTLTDGAFVVAGAVANASTTSLTANTPLTETISGDSGSAVSSAGSTIIATAGAQSLSFTPGGAESRPVSFAASFAEAPAVPEPSTALLASFGVLGLIRRRR